MLVNLVLKFVVKRPNELINGHKNIANAKSCEMWLSSVVEYVLA